MTNFAITKLRQSVSATKNVANKMGTTSVARFGKKLSLWHVDHVARKVWKATSVAMNQTHAKDIVAHLSLGCKPNIYIYTPI